MARKIYATTGTCIHYGTRLYLSKGKVVPVLFKGGTRKPTFVASTFSTEDEEVQNKLEGTKHFNVKYKLVHEGDIVPLKSADPKPNEGSSLVKVGSVKKIQGAINHLVARGIKDPMNTYEEVVAAATKAGIVFTKLENPE